MRVRSWQIALLAGVLLLPARLASQEPRKATQEKAAGLPACCMVVGVDSAT